MINELEVKGFQSLHDIDLKLDRFTVIVGPSGSGKSALTRALKTLTGNARGDSFITHGMNQCSIVARTDRGTVALFRGKKNEYTLIPEGGNPKSYTKLAGNVPEEVTEFLGLSPKDPLNFASQFDMPYLLTASPAEVARTLGELTNVSTIFEASREANRRRLAASSMLKTRQADKESVTVSLEEYAGLDEKVSRIEAATAHASTARSLETRISALRSLIQILESTPESPKEPRVPDITRLRLIASKQEQLRILIREMLTQSAEEEQLTLSSADYLEQIEALEQKKIHRLHAAGVCPTCGQVTSAI